MAHLFNSGHAVVTQDPNLEATLQSNPRMRIAVLDDGSSAWKYVDSNPTGSKWVELSTDEILAGVGITKNGNTLDLGGTLTDDVLIDGDQGVTIDVQSFSLSIDDLPPMPPFGSLPNSLNIRHIGDQPIINVNADNAGSLVIQRSGTELVSEDSLTFPGQGSKIKMISQETPTVAGVSIVASNNDTIFRRVSAADPLTDDDLVTLRYFNNNASGLSGSIADNQIAFGNASGEIEGIVGLEYNGTSFLAPGLRVDPTFTNFDGRIATGGNPSFGSSRIGDSDLQTDSLDIGTSIDFKTTGQVTQWAAFANAVGNTLTWRHVQNPTALFSIQNDAASSTRGTTDVESTLGLVTHYSNGDSQVFDLFNQEYIANGSVLAQAQGINMIASNGDHRKFGIYRSDTGLTNIRTIMEVSAAGQGDQVEFFQPIKGVDALNTDELVTLSQLNAATSGGGSEIISTVVSVTPAQMQSSNTTPVVLIPQPPAGQFIELITAPVVSFTFNSVPYNFSSNSFINYTDSSSFVSVLFNSVFGSTTDLLRRFNQTSNNGDLGAGALVFEGSNDPTQGDSTINFYLTYQLRTIA